jgi:hypothetical protein
MAQNVQYPSLEGIMGGMGGYITGQRLDAARQAESMNQNQALQDMFFKQQEQPLKMRQRQLENETTEAQIPGLQADSSRRQRDNQVRQGVPLAEEQRAAISKLLTGISDDDFKRMQNDIYQNMQHPDPARAADARKMYEFLPEIYKANQATDERMRREEALQSIKHRNDMELAGLNNEAGRYKSKKTAGDAVTTMDRIYKLKKASEQVAAFIREATIARQDGNEELFNKYMELAKALEPAAIAEQNVLPKPGAVDVGRLGGSPLPTNPTPSLLPPQRQTPGQGPALMPNDQEAIFRKAWPDYNPNVYEYRMGPSGVPQRRKKQ